MGIFQRKDSELWWMSLSHKGKRVRLSTGTANRKLAAKIYAKVLLDVQTEAHFPKLPEHSKTFGDLIERYMTDHSAIQKKPKSHRRDKSLKTHLLAAFGTRLLVEIAPADIAAYKTARRQAGASAGTVNRELGLARHAYNLAKREWEWTSRNPFEMVRSEIEPKGRDRWLRDEEEVLLLATCPRWLGELVEVALETGMRLGELLGLERKNVDLVRKVIYIEAGTAKNALPRTIPLSARAEATIRDLYGRKPTSSPYVFSTRSGRTITEGTVNRAFRRSRGRAALTNVRFHDLRHTFATRLCQAGVDLYVVQRLLGHQDPKMTQRYAHHCTESLRPGMRALDDRFVAHLSRLCHGGSREAPATPGTAGVTG